MDAPEDPRDREERMLDRCTSVALGRACVARNRAEASVFRFAAMSLESSYPKGADSLWDVSEQYFRTHSLSPATMPELMQSGHVLTMTRLRDMLATRLKRETFGH